MDNEPIAAVLARNLKAAMQAAHNGHGISQMQLARISGVGQTTISSMLRPFERYNPSGKIGSSPTVERVAAIARALGCEAWELLHPNVDRAHREHQMYEQIRRKYAALRPLGNNNHLSDELLNTKK